jgi:hypothetical protein
VLDCRRRRRSGSGPEQPPGRAGRRRLLSVSLALLVIGGLLIACTSSGAQRTSAPHEAGGPQPGAHASTPAVGPAKGQQAPAFVVTTVEGRPLASAELLAQQKPFILCFFASW